MEEVSGEGMQGGGCGGQGLGPEDVDVFESGGEEVVGPFGLCFFFFFFICG